MRILGIDPGLATVGIGIITKDDAGTLLAQDWLTIRTPAGMPTPDRLNEIANDLNTILDESPPELAVVEKIFFETNVQTGIDVAQARGVLLQTVARRGIPILEPSPLQMKSAITGDGKADKIQIQTMVMRILNLTELPTPDDAADALGLALFVAFQYNGHELVTSNS